MEILNSRPGEAGSTQINSNADVFLNRLTGDRLDVKLSESLFCHTCDLSAL
jgi:hypothetical protein